MYIRRKVFSILADEMGNEKLFSVNETLFEGFEYDDVDDRYFAEAEEEGNHRVLAGAGKGAGITAATLGLGAGAGYGISKGAKAYISAAEKNIDKLKAAHDKKVSKHFDAVMKGADKKKIAKLNAEQLKSGEALKAAKNSKGLSSAKSVRSTLQKAAKLVKNNPKTAAAIIAGTTLAGAGVGAAVSSKKNK